MSTGHSGAEKHQSRSDQTLYAYSSRGVARSGFEESLTAAPVAPTATVMILPIVGKVKLGATPVALPEDPH